MKKTVLITGSSRGMGEAITKVLLEEGYIVYGISRTKPKFSHPDFHFIKMDLRKTDELEKLEKEIRHLDILIHNAGIGYFRPLENLRESEIEGMLQLNLAVPILLTKLFLKKLKKNKGHIIFIGSGSAHHGAKLGTVYCASKFGLRGFSEALFAECRNDEVKVTIINPGSVNTSFFDDKDFAPANDPLCHIEANDIAVLVSDVLKMRPGSVVREINVNPQQAHIVHKREKKKS